jgi:hypothetical protein
MENTPSLFLLQDFTQKILRYLRRVSLQNDNVIVIGKMKMSYPWLDMGLCQGMALGRLYEAIFFDDPISGLFSVNIDLLRSFGRSEWSREDFL